MLSKEDTELIQRIEDEIKWKKRLQIVRISVAIGLVLCIVWFSYVNYGLAKDYNKYRHDYGELWSCYLCGYENLRQAMCVYDENVDVIDNEYRLKQGLANVQACGPTPGKSNPLVFDDGYLGNNGQS